MRLDVSGFRTMDDNRYCTGTSAVPSQTSLSSFVQISLSSPTPATLGVLRTGNDDKTVFLFAHNPTSAMSKT